MAQVEQVEQVEAVLQIYVEQVEQEQGGLQIDVEQVEQGQGVCPAEPLHLTQSGTTRPWKIRCRIIWFESIFCDVWRFFPKIKLDTGKTAQYRTNRTLFSHERTSVHFLVLPGSLLSFTEITEYTYISLI